MKPRHILVPLDLSQGKTDTLLHLQRMAEEGPVCATLLSVVELNIAPSDRRLYPELCKEARSHLAVLSRIYFGHEGAARLCVRVGRADQEILAEARYCQSELILMSSSRPRRWHQLFRSRTVERVVQFAPCPTLVLPLSWSGAAARRDEPASVEASPRRARSFPHPTWADA
ncbi:MAG: universal stress protein [Verrucomicrobiota bacterium]|jgi:nucleotide-binding universal stress UspA family protein